MTNSAKLRSQKIPFKKLESRYIAKYSQYKDIDAVANGKLIMLQFVQIHAQLQGQ